MGRCTPANSNPHLTFDSTDRPASRDPERTIQALSIALALPSLATADKGGHVMLAPGDVKWGDAPPILPAGARLAVLYGDPGKEGVYVIRLRYPRATLNDDPL